jgi:DNA-directed RNA polymerase subunit M/transcription elongation factor TFIIS
MLHENSSLEDQSLWSRKGKEADNDSDLKEDRGSARTRSRNGTAWAPDFCHLLSTSPTDMPSARRAEKIGVRYAPLLSFARIDESRTGALLFCPDCGTLLDLPRGEEDSVTCEQCGHEEPADCMCSLSQGYIIGSDRLVTRTSIHEYRNYHAFPSRCVPECTPTTASHHANQDTSRR